KEKSREAARSRRRLENQELSRLSRQLPLHTEIGMQLDKTTIVRLVVSYFKLRDFYQSFRVCTPLVLGRSQGSCILNVSVWRTG
ncbi:uncharacterized protein DEA37_0005911, partial [Paragonimus westermani]